MWSGAGDVTGFWWSQNAVLPRKWGMNEMLWNLLREEIASLLSYLCKIWTVEKKIYLTFFLNRYSFPLREQKIGSKNHLRYKNQRTLKLQETRETQSLLLQFYRWVKLGCLECSEAGWILKITWRLYQGCEVELISALHFIHIFPVFSNDCLPSPILKSVII